MKVRVLGCSGAIARDCRTTSFLIDHDVLIDAGTGVGDLTLEEMVQIDHIFVTPDITVTGFRVITTEDGSGSDHRPIVARLILE